ncbi:MAG: hypothetical protein HYX34_05885 [Actinobacteria bacterium]|nr:hypothetical protein [Actinomycetota bacterium]
MTEHDALLRRIDDAADEVADVLAGAGGGEPGREVLTEAREHLATAWHSSAAGTELPPGTRLRQVKRGVLAVTRPLTAQQVPFNREVVVAVDRLARVVDELIDRVALTEDRSRAAGSRMQAALATTDLAVDDLAHGAHRLASAFDDVVERVERLEQRLADQRADVRALRSRQDIVLRALADLGAAAVPHGGDGPSPAVGPVGPVGPFPAVASAAAELAAATDELSAELAELAAGPRDEVVRERARWWSEIGAVPGGGPVVDLAAGRGEWLEVLAAHEVEAWGVEANGHLRAQAQRRGLDVRDEDPLAHLGGLDEASVGAVSAFGGLAGRLRPAAVAELVDRALVALRPGGALVIEVPNVTALDVGAAEVWLDPLLDRPAHPAALELLVLARGFAEAEVRWREPVDEAWQLRADDLGTRDGARAEALVERLNRLLAGPRRAAVVARKAGAPPG